MSVFFHFFYFVWVEIAVRGVWCTTTVATCTAQRKENMKIHDVHIAHTAPHFSFSFAATKHHSLGLRVCVVQDVDVVNLCDLYHRHWLVCVYLCVFTCTYFVVFYNFIVPLFLVLRVFFSSSFGAHKINNTSYLTLK